MTSFPSRRDLWLVAILTAAVVVEIGAAVAALSTPAAPRVVLAVVLLAGAALITWTLVDTRYVVDGVLLIIRCGPFRWRFPLASVRRMTRVFSLASAPALSAHRVVIDIRGSGPLEISPADPQGLARAVGTPLD
jgi:hypothetical protein